MKKKNFSNQTLSSANKKLIKNYDTKESLLFVDRERKDSAYLFSLCAAAANSKFKKKIYLLTDKEKNDEIIKSYKNFGFQNFLEGVNKFQYFKNFVLFIKSFISSIICIIKIKNSNFLWFINFYKINNILFGDLIYDTYIRFNDKYTNPKIDINFFKLLVVCTFRVHLLLKYIKNYNVKIIIVGTEYYAFNDGVALRISTYKKEIRNFTFRRFNKKGYFEILEFDKKVKFTGYNSLQNKLLLKRFSRLKISKSKINEFYNKRKNLKSANLYTRKTFKRANKGLGHKFISKVIKLRKNKKIILYASHALADASHNLGINYSFQDYYSQFKETLINVYKNDDKNIWIFRSHPSSNLNNERQKLLNLIIQYPKKNIFFCPLNVPIIKLSQVCDTVVTGRGTIALEFLCEKKQAILAGVPRYLHRGLNLNYCTKKEKYFKFINQINYLQKPTKHNSELAKKILYFYEMGFFVSKKIDYCDLAKDKQILKVLNIFLKSKVTEKDYKEISNIFKNKLENSNFFSLIRKKI
tara:strand:- start:2279 stop:3850 length:1572 start_codon:yes stop_codon:yes gene_type:complete